MRVYVVMSGTYLNDAVLAVCSTPVIANGAVDRLKEHALPGQKPYWTTMTLDLMHYVNEEVKGNDALLQKYERAK